MRPFHAFLFLAAVALLAPGASRAQTRYNIQAIVNGGDRAGDFVVCPCGGGSFEVVGLNDAGQVSVLVPGQTLQTAGQLSAEAAPGQTLPGGSTYHGYLGAQVSRSNAAGQICFITQAGDGTAAYRMEPDGRLSLVLPSGTPLSLGTVEQVGGLGGPANVGINNKGQVALPAELLEDINQRDAVLLLTPAGP
jgi:hypothetical protein